MITKVVLAGGSGYIGSVLVDFYRHRSREVVILSRGVASKQDNITTVHWNGKDLGDWVDALNGAEILINLTGKNVNCRYNRRNREEILNSRVDATIALGKAIGMVSAPPKIWIQCASATIYRHAEDRPMDEANGEIGTGFSVDVCKAWEQVFWNQSAPVTRKILFRTGIVLGPRDGVFPRLSRMVTFGLGGKQGNGKQFMSWIHEADVVNSIHWVCNNPAITGTFNLTAPGPLPNAQFMRVLRNVIGMRVGLPAPAWLLRIGAWLIGTETELILKSRWVVPSKLMAAGYVFEFPELREALVDIQENK